MQILILYYSKSGNTRKLAEAIANGVMEVEGTNALLKRTDKVTKDDLIILQYIDKLNPTRY